MLRFSTLLLAYLVLGCHSLTPDSKSQLDQSDSLRNQSSNYGDTSIDYKIYTRNIDRLDLADITSDWQWLLQNRFTPIIITNVGDMFLKDQFQSYYFLDTGVGKIEKVAASRQD